MDEEYFEERMTLDVCSDESCIQIPAKDCKYGYCGRCCSDIDCTAHRKSYRKRYTSISNSMLALYAENNIVEQRAIYDSILSLQQEQVVSETRSEFEDVVQREFEDFQRNFEEEIFEKTLSKNDGQVVMTRTEFEARRRTEIEDFRRNLEEEIFEKILDSLSAKKD